MILKQLVTFSVLVATILTFSMLAANVFGWDFSLSSDFGADLLIADALDGGLTLTVFDEPADFSELEAIGAHVCYSKPDALISCGPLQLTANYRKQSVRLFNFDFFFDESAMGGQIPLLPAASILGTFTFLRVRKDKARQK